jgi:hypothetical protein
MKIAVSKVCVVFFKGNFRLKIKGFIRQGGLIFSLAVTFKDLAAL